LGEFSPTWGSVFFGQFIENCRSSPNFWATIFSGKTSVLVSTRNGVGYTLGKFLKIHLVTLLVTQATPTQC
jgi:hypothetical protein